MPDDFAFWIALLVLAPLIIGAAIVERIRYPDPKERHRRRRGSNDGGDPGAGSLGDACDGSDGGSDGGGGGD